MALRFLKPFSRLTTASAPTVTIFHKPSSTLSNHLLSRLASNSRYSLDVRTNRLPLYLTYRFVHEECINIHPQNAKAFEAIFPNLLATNHLFCDHHVKNNSKRKQFVADLVLESESGYLDKIANHTVDDLTPFIVDWENWLIATDDEGLDRIMQNYFSCGTQKSRMEHIDVAGQPETRKQARSDAIAVHPHIAEFADLF